MVAVSAVRSWMSVNNRRRCFVVLFVMVSAVIWAFCSGGGGLRVLLQRPYQDIIHNYLKAVPAGK
jgi:hypothetical protein